MLNRSMGLLAAVVLFVALALWAHPASAQTATPLLSPSSAPIVRLSMEESCERPPAERTILLARLEIALDADRVCLFAVEFDIQTPFLSVTDDLDRRNQIDEP